MNETNVTRAGLEHVRPGRDALVGVNTGADVPEPPARRRRRAAQSMVPEPEFRSYYGQPILAEPTWESPDIPGYFFLGGLAGAGSVVAALSGLTGRRQLARSLKVSSMAAAGLSLAALVHDLGRPERFLNMLRVFKPTSPLSVGSWLLSGYAPAATAAALSELIGLAPGFGALANATAALMGPAVAAYTAVLISDTAVPAWHEGFREMPFVFVFSAASSAAGMGMVSSPVAEAGPVRTLGAVGGALEIATEYLMTKHMGVAGEAFEHGKAKTYRSIAVPLLAAGSLGAVMGRRSRVVSALAGTALLAGSALTRWAIFEAGFVSVRDPRYTVVPQRERLRARAAEDEAPSSPGA